MPSHQIVLLFIKAPVKGRVKTRLAESLGDDAVLDLYRNFILDSIDLLKSTARPFRICYHPPEKGASIAEWLGKQYTYQAQEGEDLGARMQHAFRTVFFSGFDRAILIGSDVPDVPKDIIDQAFDSLETNDVVIGPAVDGGYYLIGFTKKSFVPGLFYGITWSAKSVLRETLALLGLASRSVHLLPAWRDVDSSADLKSLFVRNRDTGFTRSKTMNYLRLNQNILNQDEPG